MSLVPYDDSSSDSDSNDSMTDISENRNHGKGTKGYANTANATSGKCVGTNVVSGKPNKEGNRNDKGGEVKNITKIYLPKLASFRDVNDIPRPNKVIEPNASLLKLIPMAKMEMINNMLPRSSSTTLASNTNTTQPVTFIPNVVKYKRPACNTENLDQVYNNGIKKIKQSNNNDPSSIHIPNSSCDHTNNNMKCDSKSDYKDDNNSDGEENVEESADYFGLNKEDDLPEIDPAYINTPTPPSPATTSEIFYINPHVTSEAPQNLDKNAIEALHGTAAKRQQARYENVKLVDISSTQVHPDRDEWMRNAMKSSTKYQPTGVLLDEEPAAGTRRKHQITYLAHKAKANEAELQAIWSANRQTRRVTQNKYGF